MTETKLLNRKEAAKMLTISHQTLAKWAMTGKKPAHCANRKQCAIPTGRY
jgi:predicted site-specific integrase-resolvase